MITFFKSDESQRCGLIKLNQESQIWGKKVNVNYMAGAERKITAGRSVFTSLKVQ